METSKGLLRVSGPFVLFLMALRLAIAPAWAQTTVNANWADSEGNWTTASNWNCPSSGIHCIPNKASGKSYDVFINTAGSDVILDNTSSPSSITIDGLSVSGPTSSLGVAGSNSLSVNGNVSLSNDGSLGVDVIGVSTGSTLAVGGNLMNSSYRDPTDGDYGVEIGLDQQVTVAGTLTSTGSMGLGNAVLEVGGNFQNVGELDLSPAAYGGGVADTINVKGQFANSGTVSAVIGTVPVLNASSLVNSGAFNGGEGTITIGGAVMNKGSVSLGFPGCCASGVGTLSASSLTTLGSISDAGLIAVSGAVTIGPQGSIYADAAESATGLTADSSVTDMGSLFFSYTGGTIRGNVTITHGGSLGLDSLEPCGGCGSSSVTVGGNVKSSGGISVQAEGTADATLTVNGNLSSGGSITMSGDPANGGEGILSVGGTLTNSGTIMLSPGASVAAAKFSDSGNIMVQCCPGGNRGSFSSLTAYTQTAGLTDVDGTLITSIHLAGGYLLGSGTVEGNVVNDARVSPADPSQDAPVTTLTIDGDYTQNADGTLLIDISGPKDFSILDVTGQASLDGTAEFDFLNGYVPGPNTDFAFLEAGNVTGDFMSLDFVGLKCPSCTFNLSTLSLDTGSTPPNGAVPEPGTLLFFATGMLGMCYMLRRMNRPVNI